MSDSENAVLYSLKDIPVNEAGNVPQNQQANIRTPKLSRGGGESASSLLASILDDTAQDAQLEEQRVQEELKRKAQEEADLRRKQEDLKLEDANRRIQAELERQQFANRERASMIRAIEGPSAEELEANARAEEEARRRAELEAKLAESDRARAQAEQRAADAARKAQIREQQRLDALAAPVAAAPQSSKNGLMIMAMVAVIFLLLTSVVAVLVFQSSQSQVAGQTFPKTTYKAMTVASSFTEEGFVAIPQKKVADEDAVPETAAKRPRRGKGAAKPAAKAKAKKKKGGKFKGLGSDPFGGGKIVF